MQELIIKWQRFVYFFSLPFSAYIHNNTFGASVLSMSTLLSCVASILQMNTLIVCHLKVDIVYLCISPWIVVFSKMAAVTKCILVMKTEHEAWTRHSVFTSNFFFLPLPFENRISIGLLFPPLLAACIVRQYILCCSNAHAMHVCLAWCQTKRKKLYSFCHTWCRCRRRRNMYSYFLTIASLTTYLLFHFPDAKTSSLLHRHSFFLVFPHSYPLVLAVHASRYNSILYFFSSPYSSGLRKCYSYVHLCCTESDSSDHISILYVELIFVAITSATRFTRQSCCATAFYILSFSFGNAKRPMKESKKKKTRIFSHLRSGCMRLCLDDCACVYETATQPPFQSCLRFDEIVQNVVMCDVNVI